MNNFLTPDQPIIINERDVKIHCEDFLPSLFHNLEDELQSVPRHLLCHIVMFYIPKHLIDAAQSDFLNGHSIEHIDEALSDLKDRGFIDISYRPLVEINGKEPRRAIFIDINIDAIRKIASFRNEEDTELRKPHNLLEINNIRHIISFMCDTLRPVNPSQQNDPNYKKNIENAFLWIFNEVNYEDLKDALIYWYSKSDCFPLPCDIISILKDMGVDHE